MRRVDAPRPGWYPDPGHRTRLRWWDGEDWTDIRRAQPSESELEHYEDAHPTAMPQMTQSGRQIVPGDALTRRDADQIIAEVRNVARAEIDRAADVFSQRATHAARSFQPLITEYTSKLLRWVRIAMIIATILLVGWFVFQVIFQASLFEWIGDRIDNLTDNQNTLAP
ncbi:MAG: DUF2510 domain-containing protein [Ilumatobacter sp.]|nr:DUF2510 domain-containing protein [Ilumatobacter sp.]